MMLAGALRTGGLMSGALRVGARSARCLSAAAPDKACARLSTPSDLLDHVDVFMFDCDGVIWKGDSLIAKVPETLDALRAAGKRLFFVTNNSTKSRVGYKSKFDELGLTSVQPEEIFSSR